MLTTSPYREEGMQNFSLEISKKERIKVLRELTELGERLQYLVDVGQYGRAKGYPRVVTCGMQLGIRFFIDEIIGVQSDTCNIDELEKL